MKGPIKKLSSQNSEVFLTFDDGPDINLTSRVLETLSRFGAQATFFVIGEKAKKNPLVIDKIKKGGHSIGDHSLNHNYSYFFKSQRELKNWVETGNKTLTHLLGEPPVGFRSPAGVVTPPLKRVMGELSTPWIHWNKRFFDTNLPFSWTQSFHKLNSGDIVLLHDCQKAALRESFMRGLESLLSQGIEQGLSFQAITKERLI